MINIDNRINKALGDRLNKIGDKSLIDFFEERNYGILDKLDLFSEKEKQLKKLFPNNYKLFKTFYGKQLRSPYSSLSILSEMAFIEFAPIDFSEWDFLDEYYSPNAKSYCIYGVTPFMIAHYHKNPVELFTKLEKYPAAIKVLMPPLIALKSEKANDRLIAKAESAGIEDSLRYSVFNAFLDAPDIYTLKYFTDKVKADKLTRFKCLKDAMTHSNIEYSVSFTTDEYTKILASVADGSYDKYIFGTNGTYGLLAMGALIKYRSEEIPALAKRFIDVGDEYVRRALMYAVSNSRYEHAEFINLIAEFEPTIAEFAAFTNYMGETVFRDFLPKFGKDFARKSFCTALRIFDEMEKTTYTFVATPPFPVSTAVNKSAAANSAIFAAAHLKDKAMCKELEKRYDKMPVDARSEFISKLEGYTTLDRRKCAVEFLKTDNYDALKTYDGLNIKLSYEEAVKVSDYLKSKKQSVKNRILKEFLRSPEKDKICEYLLACKEEYKREIGEEMKSADGKIDAKKLAEKKKANVYGFSDSQIVLTYTKPTAVFESFAKTQIPQIDGKRIKYLYEQMEKFVEENKNYEYSTPYASTKVTIGSGLSATEFGGKFNCYPLWEKLKAIFDEFTAYEAIDLYMLICAAKGHKNFDAYHTKGNAVETYNELVKQKGRFTVTYIRHILSQYVEEYVDPESAAEYLYQMYRFGLLNPRKNSSASAWSTSLPSSSENFPVLVFLAMRADKDDSIKKLLEMADAECIDVDCTYGCRLIIKAYERKFVSDDYTEYMIVKSPLVASALTRRDNNNDLYIYSSGFAHRKFREFFKGVIARTVNAELERGTLKTPFTPFVQRVCEIYGTEFFAKAIVKIRGLTLVRNNSDYWFDDQKNDSISKVLKTVRPGADETFDDFKRMIDGYGITRDELIRAAVYNLNFLNLADEYLGIRGFKSAVLYFAAHLNEQLKDARIEQIKEYSTIDYHDFKDGAFDFEWYKDMINTIPPDEFKRIYDNAKYITVAGLHKRAQRFFDAVNGKITAEDAKEQILKSRNKDFCLVYSLIPLKDDEDLFSRYLFFADFLKESKKYGSQRQLSERRTVDIAFDNLARNAGYSDSSVFVYEMESRDKRILDMYDGITVEGYTLALDCSGDRIKLRVTDSSGKVLSSVPKSIAKTAEVIEIADYKKSEENKRKRLKRSLEESMENAVDFTRSQILGITKQPLIRRFFERLILTDGTCACILRDGDIIDLIAQKPCTSDKLKIAHPVTLKANGTLKQAMRYVIEHSIKQPFKQVFREMYLPADSELEFYEVMRFKGFNVNLKKAVAALKNRGWGVSEDVGLRKVYYRSNTVAAIFREFDYYYIYDLDEENRELESIVFIDRRGYKAMKIEEVDPIVYSETLRDVDLMIAISANSVYDFDLAMSTFEMRRAMIESITDILGINNVSFLKENVKIDGAYGTYVVNIRTGLTFKEGKGNLLIKTIDNYDKPLALDFIDEDPMTADIVTKVLLLSSDKDIKDPAILSEIYA